MNCKKCKILTGNELYAHKFETHGLSFLRQGVMVTPELQEIWNKHKATGKQGSFKDKFKK